MGERRIHESDTSASRHDPLVSSRPLRRRPTLRRGIVLVALGGLLAAGGWFLVGTMSTRTSTTTTTIATTSTSTTAPATTTSGPIAGGPTMATPPKPKGAWRLRFDEEFSGATMDWGRWSPCYPWACTNAGNPETEWYNASQVTVGNGVAILSAIPVASNGKPFTSGLIQSHTHFDFQYGYVEARVLLPSGRGLWPALWLAPSSQQPSPEIDIFELWGVDPTAVMFAVHPAQHQQKNHVLAGANLTLGFHTFAVDWEPTSITWYLDGVEQFHAGLAVSTPMYVIANLATLGTVAEASTTTFPAKMAIDYIRVWQHP